MISYVRPHNPVSEDTASPWLKEIVRIYGAETSNIQGI